MDMQDVCPKCEGEMKMPLAGMALDGNLDS